MAEKIKRRNWPFINTDVPPEQKPLYTETWQRLGFTSERDCTRHLIRKFITENKKPE